MKISVFIVSQSAYTLQYSFLNVLYYFQPSQSKGDWVDAIIVAADHFKNLGGVNIENKKIILMTNFKVPTANAHSDVQIVSI